MNAMNLDYARDLGRDLAVEGWDEAEVGDWLVDQGIPVGGITARRIRQGFVDQQMRDAGRKDVQCTNGERFTVHAETAEGVEIDCGVIPWAEVEGFWSVHNATGRAMFIPK